ncbi:type VII secretion target [Gordonia sp. NPDC058843]|uniref:type VII secretion target n=1 Tax=Gordonia sp. NPDC058843 TaxID=3346648 RepID=UPI00369238A6
MSPSSPLPDPTPGRPGVSTESRLSVDSSALQDFSDAHRTNARMLDGGAGGKDAAVVDLAITFGLIGIEFLAAVVEFLELYRQSIEAAAAREEQVGLTTRSAETSYVDCDCAAADGVMADRDLTL